MPGLKEWLAKASGDLNAAKILSKHEEILDIAAYHTQQCAEKSFKTYLVFRQRPIPKTHDLERLLEICSQEDSSFLRLIDDALALNPYGIYSRYPDDRFSIDVEDVHEAITKATRILEFVEKKIKDIPNTTMKLFSK